MRRTDCMIVLFSGAIIDPETLRATAPVLKHEDSFHGGRNRPQVFSRSVDGD